MLQAQVIFGVCLACENRGESSANDGRLLRCVPFAAPYAAPLKAFLAVEKRRFRIR